MIAASLGDDRGEATRALERCLDHVAAHFEHEERLLAHAGYPRLPRHQASHRALLERAQGLRARFLAGEPLTGALVEFLAHEVVARHMLTEDREFFPWVAGLGENESGPTPG
jgi:hemerythrin-like metal-binding protein